MKYTAENMDRELQAAKRQTRERLTAWSDLVDGFAGPHHKAGVRTYNPENHAYEWVSNTLMQVIQDNPRVSVKSKRGGKYQLFAEGLRAAGDKWCIENKLDQFLRDGPGMNINFARGIAFVDLVENKSKFKYPYAEQDGVPLDAPVKPVARNVDPSDFVTDPTRDDPHDWMYSGHRTVWDKDELLEKAKADNDRLAEKGISEGLWDLKVLEKIVSTMGDPGSDDARKRDGIDRDEIVIWELWCPKLKAKGEYDEDKYHGSIVTLIDYAYQDSDSVRAFPREPRAYYGPECGPYALFDALKKPGDGWPVAPLVASKGQADELNAESRALTAGSLTWKRLVFTTDKKLAEAVKNKPHDTVHHLPAGTLKDSIVSVEAGGISQEQLAAFQFKRERLDRVSGLTEASKGNASTGNTATADVIANAGAQVRMALFKAGVLQGTDGLLERVLWYIFHDNQIAIYLGTQTVPMMDEMGQPVIDEMTGQPKTEDVEIWHRGGPDDEKDTWDSYEFDIEPYSMERTSEGLMQRQAAFLVGEFPQVAQAMLATPWVPWGDWAATMADLLNMPSIKKLVNQPVLAQAQMVFAQAQVQAQTTTGPTQEPASPRTVPKETPAKVAAPPGAQAKGPSAPKPVATAKVA